MRGLLSSVLTQLGVGRVLRSSDGAEAIRRIKQMKLDPVGAGATEIDLILSDWIMEPVDGATFLRWIRRHKDSPDRFMPFIMVSAYSEWRRVQTARNLGVNEFLAKPFSVAAVHEHLTSVLHDRRQYIRTDNFFGPDRRRSIQRVPENRRTQHESGVDSPDKKIRFYDPPRGIRSKIGGAAPVDLATIERIQRELDEWNDDFVKWTHEYIGRLSQCLVAARGKPANGRRKDFERINRISHELRGQGGVFGYPLVSAVAKSLFELTKDTLDRSDECLSLIQNHIETLQIVLRDEVRGDGGNVGLELLKAMRLANAKFLKEQDNLALVSREFLRSNR